MNKWTKEQTIIVFNLYCKIPFQRASSSNPDIIRIANVIGRSPNSVKMKIGNFGSFDPELKRQGIVGLANASKLDKEVWDEFNGNWDALAYESELLIAKYNNIQAEEVDLPQQLPKGYTREQIVRARVNQSFFRNTVLAAYNNTCCITGFSVKQLLIASHIKPWSISNETTERTNPQNGLCLNALHDKAFDKGLISINKNFEIMISKELKEHYSSDIMQQYFLNYENKKIFTPNRFLPHADYLEYHNQYIFKGL